jgi:3-methyladenine DNA glycosylase/8-oxoguanine DNA glycosylase
MRFGITDGDKRLLVSRMPEFRAAVETIDLKPFEYGGDLFYELAHSIVSQQLAVRAAEAVFARVKSLPGGLTPANLLAADTEVLRSCGLSARKVEYLRGIAQAALAGELDAARLSQMPDAEVIDALVKLKGVGVWTAEMLLIFCFGRRDVLSTADLGIRRGLEILLDRSGFAPEELAEIRRRVSPCGTLASLYLWRIKDRR